MVEKVTCIIVGAGTAGVATTKECAEQGVESLCFDRTCTIGGVFTRYAYPNMRFTSSTNTTQFSDFPYQNPRGKKTHHWTPVESIQYLEAYVDHFDIRDRFRLQGQINSCEKLEESETENGKYRWKVTVEFKNWEKHWTQDELSKDYEIEHRVEEFYCKYLILACGTHGKGQLPNIPGLKESSMEKIHSSDFCRRKEDLRGKNVLQMGLGESGSDIALSTAQVANHLDISLRRYPYHSGVYFPKQFELSSADTFDSRMYYGCNRELAAKLIKFGPRFLRHSGSEEKQKLFQEAEKYNDQIGEPELGNRTPLNSFGIKNFNMIKATQKYGTVIKPNVEKIEGNTVYYADGTTYEADAFVFCTGYEPKFEFLPEQYQKIACCGKLRDWWKHVAHPSLGDDLFLCGFARPNMTSFWITIELNARFIASYMAGTSKLPSEDEMIKVAQTDKEFYLKNFGYTGEKINALVDHHYYSESFAEMMGASPPYFWLFITFDWVCLLRLFWVSLCCAQYRFTGPNAKWDIARDTLVNWTYYYPVNGIADYVQGYHTSHFGLMAMAVLGFTLAPIGYGPVGTLRQFILPYWVCYLSFVYYVHAIGYCFCWGVFAPFIYALLSAVCLPMAMKIITPITEPFFKDNATKEYDTY